LYQYAPNPLGWVDPLGLTPETLIHYTTENGMKGITESGVIRASSCDIHARFGDGQYFTNTRPEMIGGRTMKDAAGTGKMSLGQLAGDIYGDSRKLNSITHFVEIDVTGLDVTEPRENTFRVSNTGDLDVSKRIVRSGRSCG
ncbi:HYD1 signature containing ADP-ribosyltransferase family protein, partial [Pectobacterium aroidearum]|uniref:HYD1 signature containing ADP-ribosyltransferase family protein n=1 Tax=Pectobacterium aroidearum TaxID=1201031 RepID=UPI0018523ABF